ncbi:MAG: hypothetical protein K1X64_01040 [Myxococcaceae bacterium]|nr:hypothetical protein [Myxococcaceae bacterium]
MTANRRVSLRPGGTFTIKTPASTLTRLHGADERFLVTTDKKFPASNIIVTAKSDAKPGDVEVSLNRYKADNGVAIARLLQGNLTPEMVRFTLVISAK